MEGKPSWASQYCLQLKGTYYEGFVEDLDSLLSKFKAETITTFGIRKSRYTSGDSADRIREPSENQQNHTTAEKTSVPSRFFWRKKEGSKDVSFDNTPFTISEEKKMDCQYGEHYFKERQPKKCPKKRLCLQGSRKIGCHAHIEIKGYTLYPEYSHQSANKAQSEGAIRKMKEENLSRLRDNLSQGKAVATKKVYFVALPTAAAHSGHKVGEQGGFAQRIHPELIQQINEMVLQGITDSSEVKRALKFYVENHLSKQHGINPTETDRSFYPTLRDIQNHIYKSKKQLELSALDQENLRLKIQEWKKDKSESLFYFRPYKRSQSASEKEVTVPLPKPVESPPNSGRFNGNSSSQENISVQADADEFEETLLYVHQEKWQRDLMQRYANNVTLLDATYKTTKYDLPLFFLCVKTNVGYSVVAEFVIQSETAQQISEALAILKQWNPHWKPSFFIIDYSEAELGAIEEVFPSTKVYLCDFHREQAWERWCKARKNGLSDQEANELLDLLRDCAAAPPVLETDNQGKLPHDKLEFNYQYLLAVDHLKKSDVWNKHESVRKWLNTTWLPLPQRWARAYRDLSYHAAVDTNNGTEAQNKLLKYSYLPKRKRLSLSSIIVLLVQEFLPDTHRKYLFENFKMTSDYRQYKSFVPDYLHNRPRSVIKHCLERKSNGQKYAKEDVSCIDGIYGKFQVKGSANTHNIDFGKESYDPSCTCKDWLKWKMPCKHFFGVFKHYPKWNWNALPRSYLNSEYLSSDARALASPLPKLASNGDLNGDDILLDQTLMETDEDETLDHLPHKKQKIDSAAIRSKIRISLKCIETLTFNITDAKKLQDLLQQVESLERSCREQLPKEGGIVLRPTLSLGERAKKLKLKYKQLHGRTQTYASLIKSAKMKGNSKYKHRYGRKAQKLRDKDSHKERPQVHSGKQERSKRCNQCSACLREDCGKCKLCKDKPKFGGKGVKKQCCIKRRCMNTSQTAALKLATCATKKLTDITNCLGLKSAHGALTANPLQQQATATAEIESKVFNYKQIVTKMTTGSSAVAHDLAIKAYPSNRSYGIIVKYLAPLQRCIDLINPDGNCMFRAVSKELLGTDRYHFEVRTLVVEFMGTNPSYFSKVLANYQSQSLKDHILQIKADHVWGTATELQAMACLYQVAIKVLTYYTKAPNYRWNTYVPQADLTKFEQPLYPAMMKGRAPPGYHVELYYHEGCHYDRIAHQIPGKSTISLINPLMVEHMALLSNTKENPMHVC